MAVPLFEHAVEIAERIAGAKRVLVVLDYDGTLTALVNHPADAHLDPETRTALTAVSQRENTAVAILSGRALTDVSARVGIEGLIYGGNHGLEISGPGIGYVHEAPEGAEAALADLARQLTGRLCHFPGAWIENKRLTLTVHYRVTPREMEDEVHSCVHRLVQEQARFFALTSGHKVLEVRPKIDWNKGTASSWIRQHVYSDDALLICVGDDETDEDAFVTLADAITVKVARSTDTGAKYQLADPAAVTRFLFWLARIGIANP